MSLSETPHPDCSCRAGCRPAWLTQPSAPSPDLTCQPQSSGASTCRRSGSSKTRRYRTLAPSSQVDESLFGAPRLVSRCWGKRAEFICKVIHVNVSSGYKYQYQICCMCTNLYICRLPARQPQVGPPKRQRPPSQRAGPLRPASKDQAPGDPPHHHQGPHPGAEVGRSKHTLDMFGLVVYSSVNSRVGHLRTKVEC